MAVWLRETREELGSHALRTKLRWAPLAALHVKVNDEVIHGNNKLCLH